jgi:hypothetical protein
MAANVLLLACCYQEGDPSVFGKRNEHDCADSLGPLLECVLTYRFTTGGTKFSSDHISNPLAISQE